MDWECANRESIIVEQKLNVIYRDLLAQMEASDDKDQNNSRAELIKSQTLWVKFREVDCGAYEMFTSQSTSRSALAISCSTEHAKTRIQQLFYFEHW